MTLEYVPIDSIKPYRKNAKKHPPAQIEMIKASMEEFGNLDPIGVWHNEVVEGHGRLIAAKELGYTEVPIIRLDELTDEQRRAYALAHNKTAEAGEWDIDLLNAEINELITYDFEDFGFEIDDAFISHEHEAAETQHRVENILDLARGSFIGVGKYDIPPIAPVYDLPPIKEWIGFNYVLSDKDPEGKAVHFFLDDYQFERIWKEPERYAEKLKQYVCVASPDFSPYADMPLVCQLYNHYRKHWVGAFLQSNGVTVIPTIRASADDRSLEWYLDGEPCGGIVLISTMWQKTFESMERAYNGMLETLKPKKIFVYGKEMELRGNVEFIKTFTASKWGK